MEDWSSSLRSAGRVRSVLRSYQSAVRLFCDFVSDPRYEWTAVCERKFGSHPTQICFEWNTISHAEDAEGAPERRALTRRELQDFLDHADAKASMLRAAGRKGWLSALRDATAFKIAYAYGLRRRELTMLDLADTGPNPHVERFGEYGVVYVRWGKASHGGQPRRRSVLTVFDWATEVLQEWIETFRPLYPRALPRSGPMWPSERSARISMAKLNTRFAAYRDELGLPKHLGLHSLRHSYVTHLIESGWDSLFVQHQVGHSHAATTALYTSVSSDFRTRTVRDTLARAVTDALEDRTRSAGER